jgi:hypothetical protein
VKGGLLLAHVLCSQRNSDHKQNGPYGQCNNEANRSFDVGVV